MHDSLIPTDLRYITLVSTGPEYLKHVEAVSIGTIAGINPTLTLIVSDSSLPYLLTLPYGQIVLA